MLLQLVDASELAQNLDSIVKSTSHSDLQGWANSNPCQIPALAGAIVTALEFCPYALSVVERFGTFLSLRVPGGLLNSNRARCCFTRCNVHRKEDAARWVASKCKAE